MLQSQDYTVVADMSVIPATGVPVKPTTVVPVKPVVTAPDKPLPVVPVTTKAI